MAAADTPDLLVVCDKTGSMGTFLTSVTQTIPQFLSVARLTAVFHRLAVLAYGDYSDLPAIPVVSFSGWHTKVKDIFPFAVRLVAAGGGDFPEAAKTAVNEVLRVVERPTVVFWYADAPPHARSPLTGNGANEARALGAENFDWVRLCRRLAAAHVTVYPVITDIADRHARWYTFLAAATGGTCVVVRDSEAATITHTTINVLLALMGADHDDGAAQHAAYAPPSAALVGSVAAETKSVGLLPCELYEGPEPPGLLRGAGMAVPPLPAAVTDLPALKARFHADEHYRDMVYSVFGHLLTPAYIEALTYNSVFGYFWRAICERRKDERREVLLAGISKALAALEGERLARVRKWLDESYNKADEIEATIAAEKEQRWVTMCKCACFVSSTCGLQYPALVLDVRETWKAQELLEVSYSCNPAVLRRVSALIAGCRVVNTAPSSIEAATKTGTADGVAAHATTSAASAPPKAAPAPAGAAASTPPPAFRHLPLSLDDGSMFRLLPHLMAPGTMVTLRPAVILAVIAVVTNSAPLAARARSFLESVKGKWFDPEANENYAWGFVKLMLLVPGALTTEELRLFTHLRNVGGFIINGRTEVSFTQGVAPEKGQRPDIKVLCRGCHKNRSFTVIASDGRCGLCHAGVPEAPETLPDNRGWWCECRACHVHYTVSEPALLRVAPKCHWCREGHGSAHAPKAPRLECSLCHNAFVCAKPDVLGLPTEGPALAAAAEVWMCPPCTVNGVKSSLHTLTATVTELMQQCAANRALLLAAMGLSAPPDFDLFAGGTTLFKAKDAVTVDPAGARAPETDADACDFVYGGKRVLSARDALEQVRTWVTSGSAERGACTLCFDDMAKAQLVPVCGRSGCASVACAPCLKSWYGAVQPGALIPPANLSCPFCKRAPAARVLATHNPRACELSRAAVLFDPGWYYAWCVACYKPAQYAAKECAREAPAVAPGFECRDCRDAVEAARREAELEDAEWLATHAPPGLRGPHVDVTVLAGVLRSGRRACPRCGIETVKEGGCDHISCPCGAHWCYRCGGTDFGVDIYEHMYGCDGVWQPPPH